MKIQGRCKFNAVKTPHVDHTDQLPQDEYSVNYLQGLPLLWLLYWQMKATNKPPYDQYTVLTLQVPVFKSV
jgi:hypothetical protein